MNTIITPVSVTITATRLSTSPTELAFLNSPSLAGSVAGFTAINTAKITESIANEKSNMPVPLCAMFKIGEIFTQRTSTLRGQDRYRASRGEHKLSVLRQAYYLRIFRLRQQFLDHPLNREKIIGNPQCDCSQGLDRQCIVRKEADDFIRSQV